MPPWFTEELATAALDDKRRQMVAAHRAGASLREVAKDFNETKSGNVTNLLIR